MLQALSFQIKQDLDFTPLNFPQQAVTIDHNVLSIAFNFMTVCTISSLAIAIFSGLMKVPSGVLLFAVSSMGSFHFREELRKKIQEMMVPHTHFGWYGCFKTVTPFSLLVRELTEDQQKQIETMISHSTGMTQGFLKILEGMERVQA